MKYLYNKMTSFKPKVRFSFLERIKIKVIVLGSNHFQLQVKKEEKKDDSKDKTTGNETTTEEPKKEEEEAKTEPPHSDL